LALSFRRAGASTRRKPTKRAAPAAMKEDRMTRGKWIPSLGVLLAVLGPCAAWADDVLPPFQREFEQRMAQLPKGAELDQFFAALRARGAAEPVPAGMTVFEAMIARHRQEIGLQGYGDARGVALQAALDAAARLWRAAPESQRDVIRSGAFMGSARAKTADGKLGFEAIMSPQGDVVLRFEQAQPLGTIYVRELIFRDYSRVKHGLPYPHAPGGALNISGLGVYFDVCEGVAAGRVNTARRTAPLPIRGLNGLADRRLQRALAQLPAR
jgi:hypothetical protein